jgi:hypothetical protein
VFRRGDILSSVKNFFGAGQGRITAKALPVLGNNATLPARHFAGFVPCKKVLE